MPTNLAEAWETAFPAFEPRADEMKTVFNDRWVRFHSLPESKRYADDAAEHQVVLDRHNAVLGSLAVSGSPVVLLTTEYGTSPTPGTGVFSPRSAGSSAGSWWRTMPGDECFWHVYAETVVGHPGRFDLILRQVADDQINSVMICPPECRWVYHPYDGGADVILPSTADRDRLRSRFAGWLSAHPGGL